MRLSQPLRAPQNIVPALARVVNGLPMITTTMCQELWSHLPSAQKEYQHVLHALCWTAALAALLAMGCC